MKISIITVTYNSADTLCDTIRSVLSQSYSDWEHIIVDGGSDDSTVELVREYGERYDGRLKFVSEKDSGIYDAMNKGLRMASGDIVGILNSDDFFTTPNVLSRIAEAFENGNNDFDAVYGDIIYVDSNDKTRAVRYYSSEGFRRWKMRLGYMPAHPSFYCRRQLYERHGLFDTSFRVAADFENLLRIIYVGRASTRYLPMNFVTMRVGGASSSGFRSHRRIFSDHIRAYRKNNVPSGLFLDIFRYPLKYMELLSFHLHTHRNV